MSIFAPFDPRGPDQRRKQLIAKLAGQAGAAQQATSLTPMPGHLGGATMSEGRSFRGASDSRIGGQAHVTQQPNILASVLARLGVSGKSHAEEMSAGRGLPIAPPAPSVNRPIPPMGSAIPTPSMSGAPAAPGAGSAAPSTVGVPLGGNSLTQAQIVTGTGALPDAAGQAAYTTVDANGTPSGHTLVDPGFLTTNSGPVPLGNGLYYDPSTGTVLGQQDVNPNLPGARAGGKTGF